MSWARDHLSHYYGASTFGNMEAHWQYAGCRPITRIAVNIPIHIARICGHSLAYFMTEGRYLDHGDDPYNLELKTTRSPRPSC